MQLDAVDSAVAGTLWHVTFDLGKDGHGHPHLPPALGVPRSRDRSGQPAVAPVVTHDSLSPAVVRCFRLWQAEIEPGQPCPLDAAPPAKDAPLQLTHRQARRLAACALGRVPNPDEILVFVRLLQSHSAPPLLLPSPAQDPLRVWTNVGASGLDKAFDRIRKQAGDATLGWVSGAGRGTGAYRTVELHARGQDWRLVSPDTEADNSRPGKAALWLVFNPEVYDTHRVPLSAGEAVRMTT